jgi:hypothetical protein
MGWVVNATEEVDRQSQYPVIVAVCIVLTLLSMVVVGARLWIRSKSRGLASDDHMALLSEVFVVAYAILTIVRGCSVWGAYLTLGKLIMLCRDKIWPWLAYRITTEREPCHIHASQLCRKTCIPVGHQLLQDCLTDQLFASPERDCTQNIPTRGLGCHRSRVPVPCWLHTFAYLRLQSSKWHQAAT